MPARHCRRISGMRWKNSRSGASAARCRWCRPGARRKPRRSPPIVTSRQNAPAISALAPLAQVIVVTGHGGDEVRFLVFPNIPACRAQAGLPDSAGADEVIGHEKVRAEIAARLTKLKAQSGNSSGHATRALLL